MSEFNNKLSELYKSLATSQKNTKGDPHKGDSMANFRGKKGVSDVGIPLSPKAAKKKATNRAGYNYPQHLRNINERREREAMQRHGITDKNNPFNEKKEKPSMQPAARSNNSVYWQPPMKDAPSVKRKNIYYWGDEAPEPEQVEYIVPYQPRKREPEYKSTGKFPKIDEAIAAAKKYKK